MQLSLLNIFGIKQENGLHFHLKNAQFLIGISTR